MTNDEALQVLKNHLDGNLFRLLKQAKIPGSGVDARTLAAAMVQVGNLILKDQRADATHRLAAQEQRLQDDARRQGVGAE